MANATKRIESAPLMNIQPENGFAYVKVLKGIIPLSKYFPLDMWILEDGEELQGPANAFHDDIRRLGMGRYSFWEDTIYFSTSDNSNPLHNGRVYTIQYIPNTIPHIFRILYQRFVCLIWKTIVVIGAWLLSGKKQIIHWIWDRFYWLCFNVVLLDARLRKWFER